MSLTYYGDLETFNISQILHLKEYIRYDNKPHMNLLYKNDSSLITFENYVLWVFRPDISILSTFSFTNLRFFRNSTV